MSSTAVDTTKWQLQKHVKTEQPITTSVLWDGKLVTAEFYGTIKVWDPMTSKVLKSMEFSGGNAMFNCAALVKGNLFFQAEMPVEGHVSWPIVKMDPNTLKITAQYPAPSAAEPVLMSMVADVGNVWALTMKGQVVKLNPDDLSVSAIYDPQMPRTANVLLSIEEVLVVGGSDGQINLFLKEDWTPFGSITTPYNDVSINELPGSVLGVANLDGDGAWFNTFDLPPTTPRESVKLPEIGFAGAALQSGSSLFLETEEGVALYTADPLVFQEMLTQGQSNDFPNLVQVDPHTVIATGNSGWDVFSDLSLPG